MNNLTKTHEPLDDETAQYMTDDEWIERFGPEIGEDGCLVELSRSDPEWDALAAADRIWTMLDCDGSIYIGPGIHFVNRMSYHKTAVPHGPGTKDVAWDVRDDDED